MRQVDEAIVSTVSQCAYIEPLRATAERYYRKQGLAVAEVDSKGSNVPFFLDSLNSSERERFDIWMNKHFQAGIKTSSDGGHLSIKLKDAAGNETNLADVGFGFSQVLPVALQLWSASQRTKRARLSRRRLPPSTVVIEQPELHLHPEYQAKIADLLKSTIDGGHVHLIVETHSPSIINRLGLLVCSGELTRDQVQVLRFDKDESSNETIVALSEFDDKGVLTNWPYGFFDA
jgi:predicted ATPase